MPIMPKREIGASACCGWRPERLAAREPADGASVIARVVVDVAARSRRTGRSIICVPGSGRRGSKSAAASAVPFGGRTVQGFVVGFAQEAEVEPGRLKPIGELLDPTPPLRPNWSSGALDGGYLRLHLDGGHAGDDSRRHSRARRNEWSVCAKPGSRGSRGSGARPLR